MADKNILSPAGNSTGSVINTGATGIVPAEGKVKPLPNVDDIDPFAKPALPNVDDIDPFKKPALPNVDDIDPFAVKQQPTQIPVLNPADITKAVQQNTAANTGQDFNPQLANVEQQNKLALARQKVYDAQQVISTPAVTSKVNGAISTIASTNNNIQAASTVPQLNEINNLEAQLPAIKASGNAELQDKVMASLEKLRNIPIIWNTSNPGDINADELSSVAPEANIASQMGLKIGATYGDLHDKLKENIANNKSAFDVYNSIHAPLGDAMKEFDSVAGNTRDPQTVAIANYDVPNPLTDPKGAAKNITGAFITGVTPMLDAAKTFGLSIANASGALSDGDLAKQLEENRVRQKLEEKTTSGWIAGGAKTLGGIAPLIAATALAPEGVIAQAIAGAGMMGATGYGQGLQQKYNELRDTGVTQTEALSGAKTAAAVEGGTQAVLGEVLPLTHSAIEAMVLPESEFQILKKYALKTISPAALFGAGQVQQNLVEGKDPTDGLDQVVTSGLMFGAFDVTMDAIANMPKNVRAIYDSAMGKRLPYIEQNLMDAIKTGKISHEDAMAALDKIKVNAEVHSNVDAITGELKANSPKTEDEALPVLSKIAELKDSTPSDYAKQQYQNLGEHIVNHLGSDNIGEAIESDRAKYSALDNIFSDFNAKSIFRTPQSFKPEIDSLKLPEQQKAALESKYNAAVANYDSQRAQYSIVSKTDTSLPDSFTIPTETGQLIFTSNPDTGAFSVGGITDHVKDLEAVKSAMTNMNFENVANLEKIVSKTAALPEDFKSEVAKQAADELISRVKNTASPNDTGFENYVSNIERLNSVAERAPLNKQQLDTISTSIKQAVNTSLGLDDSPENVSNVKKLLMSLYENPNVVAPSDLTDIYRSVKDQVDKQKSPVSPLEADESGVFDNEAEPTAPAVDRTAVDQKAAELQNQLNTKRFRMPKSWGKAVETIPSIKRINTALDKLIDNGTLSVNGKNLLAGSIMTSEWLPKLLDINSVRINWSDDKSTTASTYNPRTKTISIAVDPHVSESQIIREVHEEIMHNAHHNLLLAISPDDVRFSLKDEDFEKIAGDNRQVVSQIISKYYKDSGFKYNDFVTLKDSKINERSQEDTDKYNSILDYLSFMRRKFSPDTIGDIFDTNFKDDVSNKNFTFRRIVENYDRFQSFRDAGYTQEQAAYYSMHTGEFFARTMSDKLISEHLKQSASPTMTSMFKKVTDFFSDSVKLPAVTRVIKSSMDIDDVKKIISNLTDSEIEKINTVTNSKKFLNDTDKATYKEVEQHIIEGLGKELLGNSKNVLGYINTKIAEGDYLAVEDIILHLNDKTAADLGEDKVNTYTDNLLKNINYSFDNPRLDTKTISDYLQARTDGSYKGNLIEYMNEKSYDALGSYRSDDNEYKDIVFIRNKEYNNENTVRKLPYRGKSAFAINIKDLEQFKKYARDTEGVPYNNWDVVNIDKSSFPSAMKMSETNDYVMGFSNKKPKLEEFNPDKHIIKNDNGKITYEHEIIYDDTLGALRSTAQSIDYKTGDVTLKDGTKGKISIDDQDVPDSPEPAKFVSMITPEGKILGSAEFRKNPDTGKWYSWDTSTAVNARRNGVASSIYDYFENNGYDLEPSLSQTKAGKNLWKGLIKPEEVLGAKRAEDFKPTQFIQLMSNSKENTVTPSDMFDALTEIQNNMHKFATNRDASVAANNYITQWKAQYLRSELPSSFSVSKSEILKTTKLPIRTKLSDYVKDINFIDKFVNDADYSNAYEAAQKQLDTSKSSASKNANKNIDFYNTMRQLTRISLNTFETAKELREFTDFISQKPADVNLTEFKAKADEYYQQHLDEKDLPVERVRAGQLTPAQEQTDAENREIIDGLKTTVIPKLNITEGKKLELFKIDEKNLNSTVLTRYLNSLQETIKGNDLSKSTNDLVDEVKAINANNFLRENGTKKFIDSTNSLMAKDKYGALPFIRYCKGLAPFSLFTKENLGNISKYNPIEVMNFFDGMQKEYNGGMVKTIIDPITHAYNEHLKAKAEALTPLVKLASKLTARDMEVIGIHSLLSQRYPVHPISEKLAVELNKEFDTDHFKTGHKLSETSTGIEKDAYDYIQDSKIKENLANSIAHSYGEDIANGEETLSGADALKLLAEKRRLPVQSIGDLLPDKLAKLTGVANDKGISEMKDRILEDSGKSTIKDYADAVIKGDIKLTPEQQEYKDLRDKTYADIAAGKYSNGLTLKQAALGQSGVNFEPIGGYAPIIRYSTDEVKPADFETDNYNDTFFGFGQDLNLNESFLEKRTNNLLALNTNALEVDQKKIDQQLFYLLNSDHKNFLSKLFNQPFFKGEDGISVNTETTNYLKEVLGVYYNRGITEGAIASMNSPYFSAIKAGMNNVKAFMVGSWIKAPAQYATVVASMAGMDGGNILAKIASLAEGHKYLSEAFSEGSKMNEHLKQFAPEVFYRGLADYQIAHAESGQIVSQTMKGLLPGKTSLNRGVYALDTKYGDTNIANMIKACANGDFDKGVMLAPLAMMEGISARIAYFANYDFYCKKNGINVDFANPNQDAVRTSIQAVRNTQHSSYDLVRPALLSGIVPGEKNIIGDSAAADTFLSSLFSFKTFSMTVNNSSTKAMSEISDGIKTGNIDKINKSTQDLAALQFSKMLFLGIKTIAGVYTTNMLAAAIYSQGDYDKFKGRMWSPVGNTLDMGTLAYKTVMDNFAQVDAVRSLTNSLAETAYDLSQGNKATPKDMKTTFYDPSSNMTSGGFATQVILESVQKLSQAYKDKSNTRLSTQAEILAPALMLMNILHPIPFSAETAKFASDMDKQEKMSDMPKIIDLESKNQQPIKQIDK